MSQARWRWAVLGLAWAGFALRVVLLEGQSLWPDEGLAWHMAEHPAELPLADHPPLYFLGLAGWLRLAGDSSLALRYFSVLPDLLLLCLLWAWGCRLGSRGGGLAAALLWACCPLAVWYAGEARAYAWLALAVTLSSYALLAGWSAWLYLAAGAAGLLMHPFAALALAGHGLLVLRPAPMGRWQGYRWAWLASPLALLPWLWVAWRTVEHRTFWRGPFALGQAALQTAGAWAAGPSWGDVPVAQAVGAALFLLALGGAAAPCLARSPRCPGPLLWAALVGAPLLSAGVLLSLWPKYAPRYVIFLFPLLTWLAAEALAALWRRRGGWALAALTLAGLVGFQGWALWRTSQTPSLQRPDFRGLLTYLQAQARPGDAVILVGGHSAPLARYYLGQALPLYPLPEGFLVNLDQPLTQSAAAQALQQVAGHHRRAWLVLWQEPLVDPLRLVLNGLLGNAQRLEVRQGFEGVALLLFRFADHADFDSRPQGQHPLAVPFQDNLRLAGFDLTRDGFVHERRQTALAGGPPADEGWPSFRVGETVYLGLYWQALGPASANYTAFVQVLDGQGRWVSGYDAALGGDGFPTARWPAGESIPQHYRLTLPPTLPPGSYTLVAGLYLKGEQGLWRLPRSDTGANHVPLGVITVQP